MNITEKSKKIAKTKAYFPSLITENGKEPNRFIINSVYFAESSAAVKKICAANGRTGYATNPTAEKESARVTA